MKYCRSFDVELGYQIDVKSTKTCLLPVLGYNIYHWRMVRSPLTIDTSHFCDVYMMAVSKRSSIWHNCNCEIKNEC